MKKDYSFGWLLSADGLLIWTLISRKEGGHLKKICFYVRWNDAFLIYFFFLISPHHCHLFWHHFELKFGWSLVDDIEHVKIDAAIMLWLESDRESVMFVGSKDFW